MAAWSSSSKRRSQEESSRFARQPVTLALKPARSLPGNLRIAAIRSESCGNDAMASCVRLACARALPVVIGPGRRRPHARTTAIRIIRPVRVGPMCPSLTNMCPSLDDWSGLQRCKLSKSSTSWLSQTAGCARAYNPQSYSLLSKSSAGSHPPGVLEARSDEFHKLPESLRRIDACPRDPTACGPPAGRRADGRAHSRPGDAHAGRGRRRRGLRRLAHVVLHGREEAGVPAWARARARARARERLVKGEASQAWATQ